MVATLTPRFGQPQWSSGADSPGRGIFNDAFAALDTRGALDTGATDAVLPTTLLVDGRYAHVVSGTTRQLYRRGGGAWQQVGGNTWRETTYGRAAVGLAQGAAAREVSHPDLAAPTVTENWNGSSVRGGRQAIGDVNPAVPSALHVGDTTIAVDLATRGRVYARTTATGHRAVVASAHAADAGALFTAREPGGTDPWLVDALGRMRSQAPTAFGAAGLVAGVPLGVMPGSNDITGADVTAAPGKPGLRLFRAPGDQIGSVLPESINLGKVGWTGGAVNLTAPNVNVAGTFDVTGQTFTDGVTVGGNATVAGTLGVTGTATLGTVNADVVTGSNVTGTSVTATNGLSAQSGLVTSAASGSGAELRTRPATQISGIAQQSVRAPVVTRKDVVLTRYLSQARNVENSYDNTVTMPEDGWMRLDLSILLDCDYGDGGGYETCKTFWTVELRSSSGTTLLATGESHASTIATDDSVRQINGEDTVTISEVFTARLTAGTHTIRIRYTRDSVLSTTIRRIVYLVTPIVLHSSA